MTEIWFTSDTHFGHANIIHLSQRPFASLEEMHEGLIEAWNKSVRANDLVYHMGDFAFRPAGQFTARLNGRIHLIRGNHDKDKALRDGRFEWVKDVYVLKGFGRTQDARFWLSHYPHRAWPYSHQGSYHLHGHCHGNLPRWGRSMDVGVDVEKRYKPWHIEEVVKVLESASVTLHHPT